MFELIRHTYSPLATLGTLITEDQVFQTIEQPWRSNEINVSCIPEGTYTVKRYSSAKYPDSWEVQDVPGRTKILFHVANFANDVRGCIGLGTTLMTSAYGVSNSRKAMTLFNDELRDLEEFQLKITQFKPTS